MVKNEIHVGDTGTVFEITIKDDMSVVDVSGATTKQIFFLKPDETVLTKTAAYVTDGSDGKIKYISLADDFDAEGAWGIQAYFVLASGSWKTDIIKFRVYGNLA